MNDKSKDTNKARQDLEQLNIRTELWLSKKGNGKFIKPHAAYSFPPEKRRKFCEFIKGVKLPDGFGSNFKPKVTDNDNNIIGMKSHDCHLMMQRLLPAGAQAYLDSSIATPIIELCSFFKKICARSIKESSMLIAEDQLVHILCNFEQIYPLTFFDIMIHLVMHLPAEAILGGLPEGCIAEAYIAEEALTFCSHYLWNVPTRFNLPDRNDDGPPPTSELEVFQSACTPKSAGVGKKMDHEVKKKLIWYVLDNSPEIDKYKIECRLAMLENDLPTKFSLWFHDKISTLYTKKPSKCSLELFALASEPKDHATYYTSCIVNGVKFVVHSREERLLTQNNRVLIPGENGSIYYGLLEEILELNYLTHQKVVLFQCKWFKTNNTRNTLLCVTKNNITSISTKDDWWKENQYILATQARQDKDFIVDADVVHDNNSSDVTLTTILDDLEYTRLSGAGPSTEVSFIPTSRVNDDEFINDDDEYDAVHVLSSDSEDSN
ncbi:hypothetical protein Tco_0724865 [Tanacetum coccineum]|uniref:DUF4218 domain-containing protein n=1 Tax=Tanacetum coccineum TaxID=301880 RepID=A0ABQ4YBA8_9ASTR